MCLFMQLFWHSVSPNVTLKDNKCFCIMVDGVPSCSIGSPPSEWRQWCLKCPSNFQCNCILPLSSSSRLHPGGLPSHCGAPPHPRRSPHNPQWRPIRSSSDPPSLLPPPPTLYNVHRKCIRPPKHIWANVKFPLRWDGHPPPGEVARSRFEPGCATQWSQYTRTSLLAGKQETLKRESFSLGKMIIQNACCCRLS